MTGFGSLWIRIVSECPIDVQTFLWNKIHKNALGSTLQYDMEQIQYSMLNSARTEISDMDRPGRRDYGLLMRCRETDHVVKMAIGSEHLIIHFIRGRKYIPNTS